MPGRVEFVLRFRAPAYEHWKAVFDEQLDLRRRHGAVGHRIWRLVGDPDDYEVVIEFASLGGARGYADEVGRLELQRRAAVEGGGHHRRHWDESIRETVDTATYD